MKSEAQDREEIRNPKAEIRKKTEGRDSKGDAKLAHLDAPSEVSVWGEGDCITRLIFSEANIEKPRPLRDLAERTARFGEAVIRFAKRIPKNAVNERLTSQLVGAATSVGANYCEADDSVSGKEFELRIDTRRKESKEMMVFLRLIDTAEPTLTAEARVLWREAKELNLIFGAIWRK